MAVVGVLMIGAGVFLVWEAWTSHKNQTPVAPIQHATTAIGATASGSPSATQPQGIEPAQGGTGGG
jgi:hypothetical protein